MRLVDSKTIAEQLGAAKLWRIGGFTIAKIRGGDLIAFHAAKDIVYLNGTRRKTDEEHITSEFLETLVPVQPASDDQWRQGWDPTLVATW